MRSIDTPPLRVEGSFTSRNVVDGDWKFRNLEQKFRNLYLKLQKYINILDIFVEYFRIFTSLHRFHYSRLDSVGQSIVYHRLETCAFCYCSKPVYNAYGCALQYSLFCFIHNACSCRGGILRALILQAITPCAKKAVWPRKTRGGSCKGSCLVGLILP